VCQPTDLSEKGTSYAAALTRRTTTNDQSIQKNSLCASIFLNAFKQLSRVAHGWLIW
jgi:hypothetical protein